jgi:hypothetical protein
MLTFPTPSGTSREVFRAKSAQSSCVFMRPYVLDGCNGRLRPAKSVKMTSEKSESCVECIRVLMAVETRGNLATAAVLRAMGPSGLMV